MGRPWLRFHHRHRGFSTAVRRRDLRAARKTTPDACNRNVSDLFLDIRGRTSRMAAPTRTRDDGRSIMAKATSSHRSNGNGGTPEVRSMIQPEAIFETYGKLMRQLEDANRQWVG